MAFQNAIGVAFLDAFAFFDAPFGVLASVAGGVHVT
jgi:hypothetical protein